MSTLNELYELANFKYQRITDPGSEEIPDEQWKTLFEEAMMQIQGATPVLTETEMDVVSGQLAYDLPDDFHDIKTVYILTGDRTMAYQELKELPQDFVAKVPAADGGYYYVTADGYYYVTDDEV